MRFLRENGLGIFFAVIFLASLAGQALVGHSAFNHDQIAHQGDPVSLGRYVLSSDFGVDVLENWQSEYLQFTLYILGTVWLLQRGSPESKPLDQAGRDSDEEQLVGGYAREDSPRWAVVGGLRRRVYENSLVGLMATIWLASWLAQAITGRVAYNAGQLDHNEAALTFWQYLGSSDFWDRTLQNWQSEFLAVGSMAVLSIYLRQRGSPESKRVGAAHDATADTG